MEGRGGLSHIMARACGTTIESQGNRVKTVISAFLDTVIDLEGQVALA